MSIESCLMIGVQYLVSIRPSSYAVLGEWLETDVCALFTCMLKHAGMRMSRTTNTELNEGCSNV